ncbi:MAG: hypothetical protein NZ959_07770 [Armatimonadetes bacterium]|nr:hypothetical protein [Armatimonadota bacterium]MDW8121682.1 hypothetical protein [Armatimonadota bacterium]
MICLIKGERLRTPFAGYIRQMLTAEGVWEWREEEGASPSLGGAAVLFATYLPRQQMSEVVDFVKAGGILVALRPQRDLARLLGLRPTGRVLRNGYFLLPDHPLIPSYLGETTLQVPSSFDLYEKGNSDVLAWWRDPLEGDQTYPAIFVSEHGNGKVVIFSYDPADAVVKLHQGIGSQASGQPEEDPDGMGWYKPNDLFVSQLDTRLRLIPQADVHQRLLVHLLEKIVLETGRPFLRLWSFPNAVPSLGLLTGDSDSMKREHFDQVLRIIEDYGGCYTIYLMEQDWKLIGVQEAEELRKRGNGVAHHTWVGFNPSVSEMRQGVRRQIEGFRDRFGFQPLSHRGHCCIWVGWVDQAKILAENGILLDGNHYSYVHHQYGFLSGSGKPFQFCDETGQPINLWEQTTLMSDDCMLQDKTHLTPFTIDQAVQRSRELIDALTDKWHGVYHACFHPVYMRTDWDYPYTAPWIEAVASYLKEKKVPMVSAEYWADFIFKRQRVRLKSIYDGNGRWTYRIVAEDDLRGLTVLLPDSVQSVDRDGKRVPVSSVVLEGEQRKVIIIDLKAGQAIRLTLYHADS